VYHSVIAGEEGTANPEPVYIRIDSNKREVSFGASRKRPDITHKFMDLEWPCHSKDPCSPLDYGLSMGNADFAHTANDLAK
jgi:hypothetical protein